MKEIIAYCGLACHECGAFLATQADDDKKRRAVAEAWSKQFKIDIKPEDINCTGCRSNETLFHHCAVCEIRKCGRQKKVDNCASCSEYACDKLKEFFRVAPDARKRLDKIKTSSKK